MGDFCRDRTLGFVPMYVLNDFIRVRAKIFLVEFGTDYEISPVIPGSFY